MVIHRQLLPFADPAQAHVEDVALHDARDQIWAAAVVDVLGAASAHRAVQDPITIEREVICAVPMPAFLARDRTDLFASVFDDFTISRNRLSRVNSASVYAGLANLHAID